MELRISHSCPSCGAPVEMREADRLTECSFCDVQNYMINGGMPRFVLPFAVPETIGEEEMLYFPYLRFKGNIFTCEGTSIDCKVLDMTYRGIDVQFLPPTLGLRPQAMKVCLVGEGMQGRFAGRKDTAATVLQRAARLAQSFSDSDNGPLYHRAFIGETLSCVYLPLYVDNDDLYEAVLRRPVAGAEGWLQAEKRLLRFRPEWKPRFIGTMCPQCGDAMRGRRDGLSLQCRNCDSCWMEQGGRFVRVDFQLVAGTGKEVTYLPFWKIAAVGKGVQLQTFADLLLTTNQPVVVTGEHRSTPLEFWIPALKLRPKIFLQLAKGATLSQQKFPAGEKKLAQPLHPVTLPLPEAIQALKSVVAETAINKHDVLPKLPRLSFSVSRTTLVYLPFSDTGHDLVEQHSSLCIASSIVRLGTLL